MNSKTNKTHPLHRHRQGQLMNILKLQIMNLYSFSKFKQKEKDNRNLSHFKILSFKQKTHKKIFYDPSKF